MKQIRQPNWKRWNWKRRLAAVLGILLLILLADYVSYPLLAHPVGANQNRGENGLWLPAPLNRYGWTEGDFQDVAPLCDQMAVMCYDSGVYSPRGYVWLVHQQVVHVSAAVASGNPKCRVLFGVPTYAVGGLSHHAPAENIRMGLLGVREGLSDPKAVPNAVAGVAPFADYTTQAQEWNVYNQWWLRP